jgi:hypothetical protein
VLHPLAEHNDLFFLRNVVWDGIKGWEWQLKVSRLASNFAKFRRIHAD